MTTMLVLTLMALLWPTFTFPCHMNNCTAKYMINVYLPPEGNYGMGIFQRKKAQVYGKKSPPEDILKLYRVREGEKRGRGGRERDTLRN